MTQCNVCPRKCNVDRKQKIGFCGANENIKIARASLHFWEEPFVSGKKGSGTIFFSHCNLKCVFCQNYQISAEGFGQEVTVDKFFDIMTNLAHQGAENINLVTPTHFVLQILPALQKFKLQYNLPIVYNCGGYEDIETLKKLEGVVDVYLPDMKYFDARVSQKYSNAPDYFEKNTKAILEMKRQQPQNIFENDMLKKGLVVRHLIMPTLADQSIKILHWINDNLGNDTFVSLMAQYQPFYKAKEFKEIDRKITQREYDRVVDVALELGFDNMLVQELTSSDEKFVPVFDLRGI